MLFYGRSLGMTAAEIRVTRWGEMLDMLACLSIKNGAEPKRKKKTMSFLDVFNMR